MKTETAATGYTKAQAKRHDAKLAEATTALRAVMDRADNTANDIHRAAGYRTGYYHGRRHATWRAQSIAARVSSIAARWPRYTAMT